MTLDFTVLKSDYSIYRLKNDSDIPIRICDSDFYSVTRTRDELSIVCENDDIRSDSGIKTSKHWRILKINGPLDLSSVGFIANISNLLKDSKIPVFIISTFDTDYILIKNKFLKKTIAILNIAGHKTFIEK